MTEITEDILNTVPGARAFNKPDQKHNWLYSVVPLFPSGIFPGGIYLAGFCKQCRNGFTVRMKETDTPGHVLIDKLDIPTGGCIPVE
jgi:hypothetical protein